MVVNGVSTRKVARITEELCGTEFSASTVSNLCNRAIHEEYANKAGRAVETLDQGLEEAVAVLVLPGLLKS